MFVKTCRVSNYIGMKYSELPSFIGGGIPCIRNYVIAFSGQRKTCYIAIIIKLYSWFKQLNNNIYWERKSFYIKRVRWVNIWSNVVKNCLKIIIQVCKTIDANWSSLLRGIFKICYDQFIMPTWTNFKRLISVVWPLRKLHPWDAKRCQRVQMQAW